MTKLTNKQVNLLDSIKEGPLTAHEVADVLDFTTSSVRNGMRRLEDRNLVRRIYPIYAYEPVLTGVKWELTATGRRELTDFLNYRD